MVDISTMAIHIGLATKNRGTSTLQALFVKIGYHFLNSDEIMQSDVFNIATSDQSKYA